MHFTRTEAFWLGIILGVLAFGVIATFLYAIIKTVIAIAAVIGVGFVIFKLIQHAINRYKVP